MSSAFYLEFTNTLANGESWRIDRAAQFLTVLDATADFQVAFDDGPASGFREGLTFKTAIPFQRVEIINNSGATSTIKIGIGSGHLTDSRLSLSGSMDTREVAPPDMTVATVSIPANDAAKLADASTTRNELILTNRDAGATLYLHPSDPAGVNTDLGKDLFPLAEAVLKTGAEVWAHNPSAGAITVQVTEFGGI